MGTFISEPKLKLQRDAGKATYRVMVEADLLPRTGGILREAGVKGRAAIISDKTVSALYAARLQPSLTEAGYESAVFSVPPGEGSKSLERVQQVYAWLSEKGFSHSDFIIALGGGTVIDIAGFAAGTYMRGMKLFNIPTTLIAQTDAALGGKTGYNFAGVKNLIGAFYSPEAVLIDTNLLNSLPAREMNNGMAEVIKYALLALPALWDVFRSGRQPKLLPMVEAACRVKMALVDADPYDTGVRRSINFGHTLGHCYESLGNFSGFSHGEAVAAGMVKELSIGEKLGLCDAGLADTLKEVLTSVSLPCEPPPHSPGDIRPYLKLDKKQSEGKIQLALIKRPGEPVFHMLTADELIALL